MSAAAIALLFSTHAQTTPRPLPRAATTRPGDALSLYVDAILTLFLGLNATLKPPYMDFWCTCFHVCRRYGSAWMFTSI